MPKDRAERALLAFRSSVQVMLTNGSDPRLWLPCGQAKPNTVLNAAASVVARLLAGQTDYNLVKGFIEFENLNDPDDVVETPAVSVDEDVTYYNGLSSHESRDYLRTDVALYQLTSTDEDQFPLGNKIRFHLRAEGHTAGVHGKAFSDSVNSKVYGGALAAARSENDPTQDVVFARFYLTEADQLSVLDAARVALDWSYTIEYLGG